MTHPRKYAIDSPLEMIGIVHLSTIAVIALITIDALVYDFLWFNRDDAMDSIAEVAMLGALFALFCGGAVWLRDLGRGDD